MGDFQFPRFGGWPKHKLDFLETMSSRQAPVLREMPYVPITEEVEELNPSFKCSACQQKLRMDYSQKEECWVFRSSVRHADLVLHHPVCYNVIVHKTTQM
ncbi:unknown [Feldmannia species virus]|uniref:Uncharacterized protein n=1 Tax=Feldmannia species virus TaxID=39420 RepID=B5LWB3_9PHYC|nr:hypothetical protein FeldSpV_gp024 [Feldmannia species virus]ACH46776.1 unknown [Feldmannia species virus]